MRTFKQIPYECHGLQYTGDNLKDVVKLFGVHPNFENLSFEEYESFVIKNGLKINTNWGDIKIKVGDYILKGKYGLQVFEENRLQEHFIELKKSN